MKRWLVLAVFAGCGDNVPPPRGTEVVALPAETTSKLDVLFVLDNEPNTLQHQVALEQAFPALLAQISIDGRPDLHLGTISPDLGVTTASGAQGASIGGSAQGGCFDDGDGGELQEFDLSIHDRYLVDSADASNHPGGLVDDVRSILSVGSHGCGFQQHLSATRAAFTNPANAGFRRSDAALGIVVLSDEDDCSVLDPQIFGPASAMFGAQQHFRCTQFGVDCDGSDMTSVGPRTNCKPNAGSVEIEDPADFIDVFRAQAADSRRVAFGAIIAPSTPDDVAIELRAASGGALEIPALAHSCEWLEASNNEDIADPAVRLAWLANQFGDRGSIGSICGEDITPAATMIGIGLRRAMGDPCVEDDVPLDHCAAVDEIDGVETPLPPCGVTSASCWELVTDETTCPNAAHQKLVVHRGGAAPAGTYTLVRC